MIDNNKELINSYLVIKNNPFNLINLLKDLEKEFKKGTKEFFYKIRNWDRQINYKNRNIVEKAARFIFLNKVCYNGLYRVNKKGYFNTPLGRYKNPKICDENNILAVSYALKNTKIILSDFNIVLKYAQKNDFIYFDPPYYPLTKTANFTSYTKNNFSEKDQVRLRNTFVKLTRKGCKVMLSNSKVNFIENLYKGYNIYEVEANRFINCKSEHRGKIKELIITNY